MTDIEKEMLKEINNNSYEVAASACYEIHKREIIKVLEEAKRHGGFAGSENCYDYIDLKLKELKGGQC